MNKAGAGAATERVRAGKFVETFFRVAGRFHGRLEAALGEAGLSIPMLLSLRSLVEAGKPLPLGQLAERTDCGKSHMTQVVDRLEAEGLVSRVPDPDDRRSVLAQLTEEGRRRHRLGLEVVQRVEREFLAGLSERDRSQLVSVLEKLLD